MERQTKQKTIIYEALQTLDHPTANNVLKAVSELDSTVSRATVFRVLAEAAENGEVQRLVLAGSSDCFDITLGKHAHMVCSRCGAISDVEIPDTAAIENDAVAVPGGRIDACHVQFFGLCPECNREHSHQNQ